MTACGHCGGWQLARRKPPAQPRSVFGSPEDIIEQGTDLLAVQTERLGVALARATHGLSSVRAIQAAIRKTGKAWNRNRMALPLQAELTHGAMLGALDADFEARTDRPVAVPSFAALHSPILLAPYDRSTDPAFATRPVKDAREQFEQRKPVTRDVYDAMTDAARRRAVTVAGAATADIVRTVQRELVRQVSEGADLRDFSRRVVPRLEAAGWTPQNDSHVENVLRTNVGTAYNAGRARQMTQPEVLRFRPYWQIVTVNDGPPRQRPTHQAVHLVVLAADDPFWLEAYPPFGYQCRCRVRSLGRRAGENLVRSGSSIQGLPDRGFTSGLSQLDVPPPAPMPPANDTLPPPANDTIPPKPRKPRKPRAPRKPKTIEDIIAANGGSVVELGAAPTPELKRATLKGFRKAGMGSGAVGRDGFVPPLNRLDFTSRVGGGLEDIGPHREDLPQNTGGWYSRQDRHLRMGSNAEAHIDPFVNGGWMKWKNYQPHKWGRENVPGNAGGFAKTRAEAVERIACHEYAHHIHLGPQKINPQSIIGYDPNDEADKVILEAFLDPERQEVSTYGRTNRQEYFAEALTAYRYYPRKWLVKNAPKAIEMVERVLRIRGLK